MTATPMTTDAAAPAADILLRDYHDARRREDQWRIPQLLLALVTPVLALVAALFSMGGNDSNATISAALTVITGVGAALLAVEVWRWHRTGLGIVNRFRTEFPADAALLLKDPL